MYVCMYVCMSVCRHVCNVCNVCMYVCMHVCMHVCTYVMYVGAGGAVCPVSRVPLRRIPLFAGRGVGAPTHPGVPLGLLWLSLQFSYLPQREPIQRIGGLLLVELNASTGPTCMQCNQSYSKAYCTRRPHEIHRT